MSRSCQQLGVCHCPTSVCGAPAPYSILLPQQHEGLLRLLHQMGGSATLPELLSGWRAGPMSVNDLRRILSVLGRGGWVCKTGITWHIGLVAEACLSLPERLPLNAREAVARLRGDKPARPAAGPAAQPAAQPAADEPAPSVATPRREPWPRQVWQPPPPAPLREGAQDFLQHASRGLRC